MVCLEKPRDEDVKDEPDAPPEGFALFTGRGDAENVLGPYYWCSQLDIRRVNTGPEHLAIGGSCRFPGVDEGGKMCRIGGELPRQRFG